MKYLLYKKRINIIIKNNFVGQGAHPLNPCLLTVHMIIPADSVTTPLLVVYRAGKKIKFIIYNLVSLVLNNGTISKNGGKNKATQKRVKALTLFDLPIFDRSKMFLSVG